MLPSEKLRAALKLVQLVNEKFVLVVEGKRDAAALRNIGVECEIVTAVGRTEPLVNKILSKRRKVALLFDFDKAGEEKLRYLSTLLLASDCVTDESIRRRFQRVFGLRFFEETDSKFEKIQEEFERKNR